MFRKLSFKCILFNFADASGSSDGSIFLWEWGVEQPVFGQWNWKISVFFVNFPIFLFCFYSTIFSVARGAGQHSKVSKLAFAQNGARFAAVDGDGMLCVWQAQPGVSAKKPYFVKNQIIFQKIKMRWKQFIYQTQKCHNKFASDVKFLGQTSTLLVTAGHSTGDQSALKTLGMFMMNELVK